MSDIPPSTPILEALNRLCETNALTEKDRAALSTPPVGVRTLGDLRVVIERGEMADAALAKKLKKALGL